MQAAQVAAQTIVEAHYDAPTTRYAHAVLGDDIEYGSLILLLDTGALRRFDLPETSVFEDTVPRLVDLDGDGAPVVPDRFIQTALVREGLAEIVVEGVGLEP